MPGLAAGLPHEYARRLPAHPAAAGTGPRSDAAGAEGPGRRLWRAAARGAAHAGGDYVLRQRTRGRLVLRTGGRASGESDGESGLYMHML